jgi:hypothetical protein
LDEACRVKVCFQVIVLVDFRIFLLFFLFLGAFNLDQFLFFPIPVVLSDQLGFFLLSNDVTLIIFCSLREQIFWVIGVVGVFASA